MFIHESQSVTKLHTTLLLVASSMATSCSDGESGTQPLPPSVSTSGTGTMLGGGAEGETALGGSGGVTATAGSSADTAGSAGMSMAGSGGAKPNEPGLTRIIVDSDANNEMDDQHAIAYALFNQDLWTVVGVTTNRTEAGGDVSQHTAEAQRVVKLCALEDRVPVHTGANGSFDEIKGNANNANYDGADAVEFIIEQAQLSTPEDKLVVIPIGKLTNVALALFKEPSIADTMHVFWLGSNWPFDPNSGEAEYNLRNDRGSVNVVLDSDVEFDIATVRYSGQPQPGTASVTVSLGEMKEHMPGAGPEAAEAVTGRAGGTFTHFGDYSIDLMSRIVGGNDNGSRALYDQAAVATFKNPDWATMQEVGAPRLTQDGWQARDDNARKVRFWHSFDRGAIVEDFFATMDSPELGD